MHVFARLPLCATYARPSSFWMGASARIHQCWVLVAHLWLHAHQACQPARASILPDKYLHMGLQGNFLKTRTPTPFSPRFSSDQILLSRSRILVLYGVYVPTPFLRMCARRLYNREEGGGGGILCWPRKIWYSEEGGGGSERRVAFGRNFTETSASFG